MGLEPWNASVDCKCCSVSVDQRLKIEANVVVSEHLFYFRGILTPKHVPSYGTVYNCTFLMIGSFGVVGDKRTLMVMKLLLLMMMTMKTMVYDNDVVRSADARR